MIRKVFYSFHYVKDHWRASQVRNMGVIEGNEIANDNKWEEVKRGGERAIQRWIDDNLFGRSCTIILIGSETSKRKWIDYEIEKSWNDGKGIVGIYIHKLKNNNKEQSNKGKNPFEHFKVGEKKLSTIVKAYNPPYSDSTEVYNFIKQNIKNWIEEAIEIRKKN